MIFDRLAIGTANWGKEYNGAKVSEDDQKRIFDYCREVGIDMIDTATAYEWDWTKVDPYFKVIVKVVPEDNPKEIIETNPYCIMSHSTAHFKYSYLCDYWTGAYPGKGGISVYEEKDLPAFGFGNMITQVPYSLFDRRFEGRFERIKSYHGSEIHVRSIFLRGRILKDYSPWTCIAFCLMNPYVDRVIIGVDSFEQLRENLRPLRGMVDSEVNDGNIIDPRKWKEEK